MLSTMKKYLLFSAIILTSLQSIGQSVLITPGNQTTTNTAPDLVLRSSSFPDIRGIRSSGTISSPTAVGGGNNLLRLRGSGFYNTTSFEDQAAIDFLTNELFSPTGRGTYMRFSTTPNGSTLLTEWMRLNHNGYLGIGTSAPAAKLDVANSSSGDSDASLRLLHSTSTAFNRLNFENLGRAGKWIMSGNVGSGPADSRWNIYHTTTGNILSVTGDGKVGILNSNPTIPFHVNSSATSTSSTTGAAAIGVLTGAHLIFDNNEINAYSNTTGTTLYLNEESGGRVEVGGSGATASDLRVNGFTELGGSGAPSIKMKKLTGSTSASAGGSVNIAHGISSSAKILAVDIHVNYSSSSWVGPNYQNGSSSIRFLYTYDNTNITVRNAPSPDSNALFSSPIAILLTYEE
jgi:hypothetical protein